METITEKKPFDISVFKLIPEHLNMGFGFCIRGDVTEDIMEMAAICDFKIVKGDTYINFFPTEKTDFSKMFPEQRKFKFMDGFSPNLNKHLHIGHFSNLVLAKAFKNMKIAEQTVCILGDTLSGEVSKNEAFNAFNEICDKFNYTIDRTHLASLMKLDEKNLLDGVDEYAGTKVVQIGDKKIVVIKKDGSTSYFYQDIALCYLLNEETLYLTGYEQENHFNMLKELFPQVFHVGLGLVKFKSIEKTELGHDAKEKKMSTRDGNVIFMSDLLNDLKKEFNNDEKLSYNIFAGYILKNHPKSDKVFNMDTIKNPKNSPGLYLSYTMARLKSAGVNIVKIDNFIKQSLQFAYLKSKHTLNPSLLFKAITELCQEINNLYVTHQIAGNDENKKMFELLLSDLALGMDCLGMFKVNKV